MKKESLLAIVTSALVAANSTVMPERYTLDYRMTYERLDIAPDEKMGLIGLSALFEIDRYIYGGFGIYGAVDGERGGFFTVGVDGGLRFEISNNLSIQSGIFVGAGGGGAAPQGGGLMLRPYLQANYELSDYSIGAGISHINFPNGEIESTQGYISLSMATEGIYLKGHQFDILSNTTQKAATHDIDKVEISFLTQHYKPRSGSLNTDGTTPTKPYTLAGVKFAKFLDTNLYGFGQAAGAGGGDSDGYMEIFGGIGYRYQVADTPLYVGIEAAVGAAGGGRVDTGGGLIGRAQVTAGADITDRLSIDGFGGIISSADGTFSATTYGATLNYSMDIISKADESRVINAKPTPYSLRILNKSYLDTDTIFKGGTSRGVDRVDLLGFAIDWYLNDNLYITGQTYWAYKGKAGGYAEGVFGIGYHTDSYHGVSLYAEALAGVGGGGGIDIGGGLWGSLGGGATYSLNDSWEISLGGYYTRGIDGSFDTKTLILSTTYNFSMLESE